MTYTIRNQDDVWDVSAEELAALGIQPGDSLDAEELAASLARAAIPSDLRAWLAAMVEAAPEQTIYVEACNADVFNAL